MNIQFIISHLQWLLIASTMTIKLTVVTLILGSILGIILALFKMSKNKLVYSLASFYTWVFRGTPLLLQLFFFYYALPSLNKHLLLTKFSAAVLGLSLNCGAYMAEIIRGGIISIDKGQFEASKALGFTYFQTMRKIILPQTLRVIIPPVGNEFIAMLKDTSLVSSIALVDLMRSAQQIGSASFKYPEMFLTAAVLYLIMTTVFTTLFTFVEKKLSVYA